uniref:Uncharacterized protein n=1 Tax=Cryptococcus bacillisporus CA1280 TaxID=1296109 RepID=A0A0D0UD27_CRYGA|nr:hypothetical protein I312_04712 [Cryptococcus bacillisporus CA1280]
MSPSWGAFQPGDQTLLTYKEVEEHTA